MPAPGFSNLTVKTEAFDSLDKFARENGMRAPQLILELSKKITPAINFRTLVLAIEMAPLIKAKSAVELAILEEMFADIMDDLDFLMNQLNLADSRFYDNKLLQSTSFMPEYTASSIRICVEEVRRFVEAAFQSSLPDTFRTWIAFTKRQERRESTTKGVWVKLPEEILQFVRRAMKVTGLKTPQEVVWFAIQDMLDYFVCQGIDSLGESMARLAQTFAGDAEMTKLVLVVKPEIRELERLKSKIVSSWPVAARKSYYHERSQTYAARRAP